MVTRTREKMNVSCVGHQPCKSSEMFRNVQGSPDLRLCVTRIVTTNGKAVTECVRDRVLPLRRWLDCGPVTPVVAITLS